MTDLFTALGLVLVIEGALYALFPEGMKRVMAEVLKLPTKSLRTVGLVAAAVGTGLVWWLRG
ncbi:MAG: DUF2065 domain-containing protein [Alphaproteobacteria bacterium]|jgi:hypothetical protein